LEERRNAFIQTPRCVLGHFAGGLRMRFADAAALASVAFRVQLLTLCWVALTSIMRLECGHAGNRRAMYTGGKQGKAPRFSRISAAQFIRNLRCRFTAWMSWLMIRMNPWEPEPPPPATKKPRGGFAFRIWLAERIFPRGRTPEEHDEEVQLRKCRHTDCPRIAHDFALTYQVQHKVRPVAWVTRGIESRCLWGRAAFKLRMTG
jgi:hypothetical protein